ncbi:MAG TPA: hypothetical protein VEK57_31330 [Thermoanaerobaculia bacterium]|nr:hypothetical protein [Thermoanaerobaculia bacterium]
MRFLNIIAAAVLVLSVAVALDAQDAGWIRDWEEAQRQRPRVVASVARIAPASEPGTPLVVHGRVVQADGKTPVPDLVVFAYQTDNQGVYNTRGESGWRLRGYARTDKEGRFEFHTIRPASYPSSRIPAHIHLTVDGPRLPRRWAPELRFADDPFVSASEKRESTALGAFGPVRPVTVRERTQHVDFNIRIADDGRF